MASLKLKVLGFLITGTINDDKNCKEELRRLLGIYTYRVHEFLLGDNMDFRIMSPASPYKLSFEIYNVNSKHVYRRVSVSGFKRWIKKYITLRF